MRRNSHHRHVALALSNDRLSAQVWLPEEATLQPSSVVDFKMPVSPFVVIVLAGTTR